jgi:hypothetical protein
MRPGDDCPQHLARYATASACERLSKRFSIPIDDSDQDWELSAADPNRAAEFLAAFADPSLEEDDRALLMWILIASLDDLLSEARVLGTLWPGTRRILEAEPHLHASTMSYWARGNDDDPEHQFRVTPLIRDVWRRVLARLPSRARAQ